MLGKEVQVLLATLSQLVAAKTEEPILHVKGWFNSRIAIAVAKSYSWMIRGARITSPLQTQ